MIFPKKCPYCGKDNVPHRQSSTAISPTTVGISLELHRCVHCNKPIFVAVETKKIAETMTRSEIIYYYPTVTTVEFPTRVKELSPNAHKTYEQTIKAKDESLDMLVGAGLRIALEWLVTDYLVKVKGCVQTDIEKLKLYERIDKMKCDFYTEVCTRLIRLYGNDNVHTKKKLDFTEDEVIEMFNLLCSLIDSELQIKEVSERLPKKS